MKNLWRKVEDGLPEQGQRVLVYSSYHKNDLNDLGLVFRVADAQFVRISRDITHWMPIEPPDEEVTK